MARVVPIAPALPSIEVLAAMLKRYATELSADELPALMGELENAKAAAWARLTTPAPNWATKGNAALVVEHESWLTLKTGRTHRLWEQHDSGLGRQWFSQTG